MKPTGMFLLAVALAASATAAPSAIAAETPPLRLTIAFTGDVGGYLEPCG